jgi:hypothetical protein
MYYASSSIEGRCAIFLVIDTVVSSTYSHELAWITNLPVDKVSTKAEKERRVTFGDIVWYAY